MYTCPNSHTPQSAAAWTCADCREEIGGKQSRVAAIVTCSAVAGGLVLLGWSTGNLYSGLCGLVAAFGIPAVLFDREDDHTAIFLAGVAVTLFLAGLALSGALSGVMRAALR